jgi:2-polyprenyl-3-methyl-5-hydroxy-6-metoxy-1,4-benzoquinol methylase
MEIRKKINNAWKRAPQYAWGNPLDVRYYLCEQLGKLRNKTILDVGCNAGVITGCLHTSNFIYAVDTDSKALAIAQQMNTGAHIVNHDMFKVGKRFRKEMFDVIILAHVLPKDNFASEKFPEELLDEIIPLLKRKGTLYITTPSAERAYNRKHKFINRPYIDALLQRYNLRYVVLHWCPWSIHINRFMQFIPGIHWLLRKLSVYRLRSNAFYVQAIKI